MELVVSLSGDTFVEFQQHANETGVSVAFGMGHNATTGGSFNATGNATASQGSSGGSIDALRLGLAIR